MSACPGMPSRPRLYQYLSRSVAVSVGNEAYHIAPSILHDAHRMAGWTKEIAPKTRTRASGVKWQARFSSFTMFRISLSQRHVMSLSAKDSQILLIGRVVWVCAGVEWMLRVLIKAHANPRRWIRLFLWVTLTRFSSFLLPSPASAPLSDGFLNYLRLSFSSITLFPRASPDIPPSLFSPSSTTLFVAHNNLLARSLALHSHPPSNASPAWKALRSWGTDALSLRGLVRRANAARLWICQRAVAFSWIVADSANIDSLFFHSLYLHKSFTSFKLHKG